MKNLDYLSPQKCETFSNNLKDIICSIPFISKGKKEKIANVASVFDIEASSFYDTDNNKKCCMYAWVFGLNGRCIRGRTWDEFIVTINELVRYYDLSPTKRLIIYVHNLGYEFQWFRKYFEWEKVFSIESRKPLYAITKNGIEFRCSYLLSGYSLEKLGENLVKYKVNKMVGDLDYNLIRHSKTPLNDKEWTYILNDGLVVMAHIQEEIERLGDITKLPLTKTGYVRNLCKEKCLKGDNKWDYAKTIRYLTLTPDTYKQFKRTYMGGFTHANINYVGETIENVHSYDFTSSYPSVMIAEKYPMSKPYDYQPTDDKDFIKMLKAFCCMFYCKIYDLEPRVNYENYISISRCIETENPIVNNGRIVEADSITMAMTEQDFFIIAKMYKWEKIEVYNFKYMYKDYLPKDFIMTILELYKDKTELKDVEGKEVEYLVAKGMINACYGMTVTDPCKDEDIYDNHIWKTEKSDIVKLIDNYNRSGQRFLYYAWGIWVTAYARANLFNGIFEFENDYIYSDTDSIKVLNREKHLDYIEKYNIEVTTKIENCLKYYGIPLEMAKPKTKEGVEKPLGVWDYEGKYTRFKTLGAKRYITEHNGKLSITIAGVNKKSGIKFLQHTYKDNTDIFNNFTDNLTFPAHYDRNGVDENGSGKLCHTYIDEYMDGYIIDYLGNKWIYNEQSGVHMENTEYTMNLNQAFINLILGVREGHII